MRPSSTIPAWNNSGIIPPIRPGEPGHSSKRSPYRASLIEVIDRFCTSQARASILEGYLQFREALQATGLDSGFQWLNGSFVEDKESRIGDAPADIDVVTFAQLPNGKSQGDLNSAAPHLFDHGHVKATYKVDGYFQFLGDPSSVFFVRQTSYWNSMWSHTRNHEWKGFLQVELAADEDAAALSYLRQIRSQL